MSRWKETIPTWDRSFGKRAPSPKKGLPSPHKKRNVLFCGSRATPKAEVQVEEHDEQKKYR